MFVLKSKYRELEKERDELLSENKYLKTENKVLLKNTIGFPMLNSTEAQWLCDILDDYTWNFKPYNQTGLTSNQIKIFRSLIKKGYLIRVARGKYQLTFAKYA